jgi:hypothetical protein
MENNMQINENDQNGRRGKKLAAGLSSTLLILAGFVSANADTPAGTHITICHRTGSASNPYVVISPDVEGVINGHLDHEQTGNGLGGDIIPTYTYNGVTYSKNLDGSFGHNISGRDVLANGCNLPAEKGTPTPTPTPPGGPTPPPLPVPEPMTLLLFGTGLSSVAMAARRKFGKKGESSDEKETE